MNFRKPWAIEIYQRWIEIDVQSFLEKIGVNFQTNFAQPLSNCNSEESPFLNSKWQIIPHSAISNGVLHCYPLRLSTSRVIWEEWFLLDGNIHHHLLSNLPFPSEQGIWTPDATDVDHPQEVLGRSWHYENLTEMKPVTLNRKGF